jgi:menaquinone-dependent protoporphyrinogen oxidase
VIGVNRILVAYATRNGSTGQVAEAVAAAIQAGGVPVEVRPVSDVRGPVDGFALVVLGAPLYSGRWHRDAHRFLKRHREELARMPVAVFGMGPRTDEAESWQHARQQLDRALARRDWLAPVAVAVFGGVDPPRRRADRPHRDLRDWEAIRSWAGSLRQLATEGIRRPTHPRR